MPGGFREVQAQSVPRQLLDLQPRPSSPVATARSLCLAQAAQEPAGNCLVLLAAISLTASQQAFITMRQAWRIEHMCRFRVRTEKQSYGCDGSKPAKPTPKNRTPHSENCLF